jgi:CHASE2 domain-containing sensor protein
MDSLKVSTISASSGLIYWLDVIPAVLMSIMFLMNIYYLYQKTKKIKES